MLTYTQQHMICWFGYVNGREQRSGSNRCAGKKTKRQTKRETKREMDGLCPKRYAGIADHPRGCPGQKLLEVKNSGR